MKVKDCNNCPFCVIDFDPDYVGDDTLLYCNLVKFKGNFTNNLITTYNSWNEENIPEMKTPDFCPLKEGNITIELEEINK